MKKEYNLKTYIGNYLVSTVELPFPILIHKYETMIFKVNDGVIDFNEISCYRYKKKVQATIGHKRIVNMIKNGENNEWYNSRTKKNKWRT